MMNDDQLENKVRQDAAKVKKDFSTLVEDSAARFGRLEVNVSQATDKAKEDLTSWADDAKESVVGTAATVKKDVGDGLNEYNARAQRVADKVPGGFSEMIAKYPWVAISIAVAVGLLLASLFKPTRHTLD